MQTLHSGSLLRNCWVTMSQPNCHRLHRPGVSIRALRVLMRTFQVIACNCCRSSVSARFIGIDIVAEPVCDNTGSALTQAHRIIQSLRLSRTHVGLCNIAVNEVRRVTGYDRVMAYRFDEDGSGEVISENHVAGLDSFLHLKYPASDIPRQARRLYMLQRLRVITDVNAGTAALLTAPGRQTSDLDLSFSSVRAVSEYHLTYLRNMGITATSVVSLIVSGQLWGMLVCQHNTPYQVNTDVRALLELVGQFMSMMLGKLHDTEASANRLLRLGALSQIAMAAGAPQKSITEILSASASNLLTLVPAHGVAIAMGDQIIVAGQTPEPKVYQTIVTALRTLGSNDLTATNSLANLCGASAPLDGFAGALLLPLPNCANGSIVWFRREKNQTVNWAGKPDKLRPDPLTGRLEPRQSFALWSEEVHGKADRWTDADLAYARDLRRIIDEAVVRSNEAALLARLRDNDSLTGLLNRRALETHLKVLDSIMTRPSTTIAVINIDRFHKVNELLGNSAGDTLLTQIAHRLTLVVEPTEQLARVSTDEFVLISYRSHAVAIGARISGVFKQPFEIAKQVLQIHSSVGVAESTSGGMDVHELLRLAETAMRQAKSGGGNQVSFFERAWGEAASHQAMIEQCLDTSLRSNRDEFHLAFQPIIDVTKGALRGWEVLARWNHPTLGNVSPSVFIPIAERCGLIGTIGDLVLEEALRHLVDMPPAAEADEQDVYLSVNVSPAQLTRKDFAGYIANTLHARGIMPSQICIEITEGVFTDAEAVATLKEIRRLGVLVAVDDFGIGHSSLSSLRRLPVDIVKLDRSFLPKQDADLVSDRSFLHAVVALAHTTGVKVVIEGVETQAQLDAVVQAGVDAIQGFLMARPMSGEETVALACQGIEHRSWYSKLGTARRVKDAFRVSLS